MNFALQQLLPQHSCSRLVGKLTTCRIPWLKNFLIKQMIKQCQIDLSSAQQPDYQAYEHVNAFFTRKLKAELRPICSAEKTLVSPVDGTISALGSIEQDQLLQAKGLYYSLSELLGHDEEMAALFSNGHFATLYLAPHNYHRVHMPFAGQLQQTTYLPGSLFSVNKNTTEERPRLFSRNERLVCLFQTDFGPMAVILVGAIFVGSMSTIWSGQVTPPYGQKPCSEKYTKGIQLGRGEEMGHFNMGSTAIVLLPKMKLDWAQTIGVEQQVLMGSELALMS